MNDTNSIYDEQYYLGLPVDSGRIEAIIELLSFEGDEIVCEIGCAAGHFLAAIADRIRQGTGIDTAGPAIRAAERIGQREQLDNIEFIEIPAQSFARDSDLVNRCHYVFLMDVTEHIGDSTLLEVLDACRKLLREDGELVIHTPNLGYWLERLKDRNILPQLDGHIAVRNRDQYRELLQEAGFRVERLADLPHYRQPLRSIDALLLHLPLIGRLFASRLFVIARKHD